MKEIANFLNSKTQIDIEDPTFINRPPNFPLNVLPAEIKTLIDGTIKDAGKANVQLFFDSTLTALANDISRGNFFCTLHLYHSLAQLQAYNLTCAQ